MCRRRQALITLACFGDSLTTGRPGVSWIPFLAGARRVHNHGRGGDTLTGITSRLRRYLSRRDPDFLVLEAGANDLLLPYLAVDSPSWQRRVAWLVKRGIGPLPDPGDFSRALEAFFPILPVGRTAVVGIPCLGEDKESLLNRQAAAFDAMVHDACERHRLAFLDFRSRQLAMIGERGPGLSGLCIGSPGDVALDVLKSLGGGMSVRLAKRRGLAVTIDGVHLNPIGARELAGLVDGFLATHSAEAAGVT